MSKPSQSLEVAACVTSLVYHPEEPSILAAGLFNGIYFINFNEWKASEKQKILTCKLKIFTTIF